MVKEFPLTSVGKLSKKDLRNDIAAKLAKESATRDANGGS